MARVEITTAGHTVVVEAEDVAVHELADLAYHTWTRTRDPKIDKAYGTTGFIVERADPDLAMNDYHIPDYGA